MDSIKEKKKQFYRLLETTPQGTVLDIGPGRGFPSILLAKKGFRVEAIEKSKKRLLEYKKNILKNKVRDKIKIIDGDILNFKFKRKYEGITSTYVLHFLTKPQRKELIKKIKTHTRVNGTNFIKAFTNKGELTSSKQLHFFKKNELKSYYKEWDILYYKEQIEQTLTKDEKGNTKNHTVATIITKKLKDPIFK